MGYVNIVSDQRVPSKPPNQYTASNVLFQEIRPAVVYGEGFLLEIAANSPVWKVEAAVCARASATRLMVTTNKYLEIEGFLGAKAD